MGIYKPEQTRYSSESDTASWKLARSIDKMAVTKAALILVLSASVSLCWENLPQIPANRRAQYYLQHDDGAYKHGYDTGVGQAASASADAANQVQGQWQYVDNDGQRVNWAYTAGDVGYVPVLVSSIGGATFKSDGAGAHGSHSISTQTSGSAHTSSAHVAAAHSSAAEQGADADYDENADASYKFGFDTNTYARDEQADSQGNIQGRYSYNSPVGGSHAVSYTAGADTGFVVTSSTSQDGVAPLPDDRSWKSTAAAPAPLPVATPYAGPPADIQSQVNPDGSFSYSYTTSDHSHQATGDAQNNVRGSYSFKAKDDGQTRRVDYHAGADTGFVATGDHLPVAPEAPAVKSAGQAQGGWASSQTSAGNHASWATSSQTTGQSAGTQEADPEDNGDGSYNYSYETDHSSKHETSDAAGNVVGSFQFVDGEGITRKLSYKSSGDEGFIASGEHLPVAPVAPVASSELGVQTAAWSAPAPAVKSWSAPAPAPAASWTSQTKDSTANDGSYSYSYSTDDQSVQQSSDAANNAKGSYSFKAKDDGQTRTVNWQAGSATGFVAQGAHLPVAPVDTPSAWNSQQTSGSWSAPVPAVKSWSAPAPAPAVARISPTTNDGSYSYSYSTDDQSVQHSADAANNVQGSYSFKAKDDGVTRRVDYTASAATGFVASGDHLPVAPSAVPTGAAWKSQSSGSGAWSQPAVKTAAWSAPAPAPAASWTSQTKDSAANDGSYSYSYSTDDQSVQQSSDAANNAKGSYSFKAKDDGQTRTVNWQAGSATGFVAQGAHLPVAPVDTPAAPSSDWTHGRKAVSPPAPVVNSGAAWNSQQTSGSWSAPAPAVKSWSAPAPAPAASWTSQTKDAAVNDGSYSYSYSTDTQNVQQSSDANNNVHGSYSFKAKDDGQTRTVNWQAGSATGFVAQGAHLPMAEAGHGGASLTKTSIHSNAGAPWAKTAIPATHVDEGSESGDKSYSYSYKTDSSSKDETSDAQGNVAGSFTYLGGDGVSRKLTYTARGEDGFQASGAHLPVAPSVGDVMTTRLVSPPSQLRPYAPLPVVGTRSSSSHSAHTSHGVTSNDGNIVVTRYLPPASQHKFGYIFDTKT